MRPIMTEQEAVVDGHDVSKHAVKGSIVSDKLAQTVVNFLLEKIPKPQLAVDIGCGTAVSLAKFREFLPDSLHFVGLDINETLLNMAKQHYPDAEFRLCNIDTGGVPFADKSVDLVTAVQSVHCLGDVNRFFAECNRTLRSGGVLALCTYHAPKVLFDTYSAAENHRFLLLIKKLEVDLGNAGCWLMDFEMMFGDYANLSLPFVEQVVHRDDESMFLRKRFTFGQFIAYMESWGGVRVYRQKYPSGNVVGDFFKSLWQIAPEGTVEDSELTVVCPWTLVMCRHP